MPDEVPDRNVFILGAGFSADAGAPLVHDFLDVSRELFDNPESDLDEREKELFGRVFEFKKHVAQAREKFKIDLDNLEELFGLIEMSHRLDPERADVRDAMVYVIAKTLQLAIARTQKRPTIRVGPALGYERTDRPWGALVPREASGTGVSLPDIYTHFALLLSGQYDAPNKSRANTVITFNYDLVLDDALRRVNVEPVYGLPDCARDGEVGEQRTGVSVLKLHGSTNWAICPRCQKVHVLGVKFTGNPEAFRRQRCAGCGEPGLHLLLVPPSWDKSEYRDTMRPVWRRAVDELKAANRICVIGYSMPQTDTFFKYLLTLGLAENHQLYRFVLVDMEHLPQRILAGDSLSEELPPTNIEARYKGMLEALFVSRRFRFFGNGFADFLNGGASPVMARAETVMPLGIF